jgi:hypothetical protein
MPTFARWLLAVLALAAFATGASADEDTTA